MEKRVKTVNLSVTTKPMSRDNTVPSAQTDKTCSVCHETKPISEFYHSEYRCKICSCAKTKRWNRANRDRFNANKRASHKRNKNTPHAAAVRSQYAEYRYRLRDDVIRAYGGYVCACCGETDPLFLTIDHINNDGAEHRKMVWGNYRVGSGSSLYLWIRNNGYPPGFQILCYNCNCGKQRNKGVCPHVSLREGVTTRSKDRTAEASTSAAGSARHPYPCYAGLDTDDEIVFSTLRSVAAHSEVGG